MTEIAQSPQKYVRLRLTWSKSSQVEHQTQQNQPGVGGGAVVVGPVGLILHQGGVGASERRHILVIPLES